MLRDNTFSVEINSMFPFLRVASYSILTLAIVLLIIAAVVDYPLRYLPAEFTFVYYVEFLPEWFSSLWITSIFLLLFSLLIRNLTRNIPTQLTVRHKGVYFLNDVEKFFLPYQELKRITLISVHVSYRRFRVEFIYHDWRFKRIGLKNKKQFLALVDVLYQHVPDDF